MGRKAGDWEIPRKRANRDTFRLTGTWPAAARERAGKNAISWQLSMRTTILLCLLSVCASAADDAKSLLTKHGMDGGVVVHLGLGDQALTAGLAPDARYVLQGLDPEPARVEATRAAVAKGLVWLNADGGLDPRTGKPRSRKGMDGAVTCLDAALADGSLVCLGSP